MTIEDLRNICKNLKGVTEDIKWEYDLCFNVGGKMFLVTAPESVPTGASFKVPDESFEEISALPGFMPAPYLARHKWVHVDDINRVKKKDWQKFIEDSYALVAGKLPARVKKELGII